MLRRIVYFSASAFDLHLIDYLVSVNVSVVVNVFVRVADGNIFFFVGVFIVAEGTEQSRSYVGLSVFGAEEIFFGRVG